MKKISTHSIVTALVAFFTSLAWGNEAHAQTVVSQSLTSGDQMMYHSITIQMQPHDTVLVSGRWATNAFFGGAFTIATVMVIDSTNEVQTITLSDSLFSFEGDRWFQYEIDGIYQDSMHTYVRTMPTISIDGLTWDNTSFTVTSLAAAGDTSATVFIQVNPFSLDFNEVNAFDVFDSTFSWMINFTETVGYIPEGSDISFRLKVVNSLGVVYSDTMSVSLGLTPQVPWIGNISLIAVDQTSASVSVDVVNYGLPCALDYYLVDEDLPNNWLMFPISAITASDDVVVHTMAFTNLTPDHAYNVYAHAHNLLGESDTIQFEFHTLQELEVLDVVDSGITESMSATSTEVSCEVYAPSDVTVEMYLYVSHSNDPEVQNPFIAEAVATITSGIWSQSFVVSSLQQNETYYGKWIAIGSDGSYAEDIFYFLQQEYITPTSVAEETVFAKQYYATNGMLYGCAESSVSIYDISGRFVYATKVEYGVQQIEIPITDTGVYIARIVPDDSSQSIKTLEFVVGQ